MLAKLFYERPQDVLRASLNLKTGRITFFNQQADPTTASLDFDVNFNRRVRHYSEFANRQKRSTKFSQFYWPTIQDTAITPLVREVFVHPAENGSVEILIDPVLEHHLSALYPAMGTRILDACTDVFLITESEPQVEPGPRIIYANAAFEKMTGYRRSDIIGRSPRLLHGNSTSLDERRRIREAMKRWEPVRARLVNYRRDGTPFELELEISPVCDETGWYVFWVAIQRDITERSREEGVRRAAMRVQTVRTIASGLAHDFNNRLAVWQGKIDQMISHADDLSRTRDGLVAVRQAISDAKGLTKQFMNLGSESHRSEVERFDLISFLKSWAGFLLEGRGAKLVIRGPERLEVCSKRHELQQVIDNLVINSLQAFSQNPNRQQLEIRIHVSESKDVQGHEVIQVSVRDNGPGIDPSILPRLFEPYVTSKPNGHGLGLFMCQSEMSRLGGGIRLTDSSHHGTEFELFFLKTLSADAPIHQAKVHGESSSESKVQGPSLATDAKILLVEDNADLLEIYTHILKKAKYLVHAVSTYDEAKRLIQGQMPTLLISDLMLNGALMGPVLARDLLASHPNAKICLISGSDPRTEPRCQEILGARLAQIATLDKPFEPEDLLAVVAAQLKIQDGQS